MDNVDHGLSDMEAVIAVRSSDAGRVLHMAGGVELPTGGKDPGRAIKYKSRPVSLVGLHQVAHSASRAKHMPDFALEWGGIVGWAKMREAATLESINLMIPMMGAEMIHRAMGEACRRAIPQDRNWAHQADWNLEPDCRRPSHACHVGSGSSLWILAQA